jgi:hypothetical protein
MKRTSGLTGAAPIWHDFMEGVLANPAALTTLEAPAEPSSPDWAFRPAAGVEQRQECPPGLACREEGEWFTTEWLAAAGEAGPLADSVQRVASVPVYVNRGEGNVWTAYCEVTPAVERLLLRLPGEFGLSGPTVVETETSSPEEVTDNTPGLEELHALAWSLRHPTPVNLGPCDTLAERIPRALAADPQQEDAGLQVGIDLAAAMDPNAGPIPGVAGDSTQPGGNAATGPQRYVLAATVSHHTSCPGQYIVGQVIGADGAPRAGVRIVLVDQWGNRADAISKSGATDFGNYDFPLNDFANQYTLRVVDEAGRAVSPPVVVDHRQGEGGDAPCHTIIWREQ